jgi:hypothetical protein
MYTRPNMDLPVDKLAHFMSEVHNDNAPIGWEQYRTLAKILIDKCPALVEAMNDNA